MERKSRLKVAFVVYGAIDGRSGGFLYDSRLRERLEARGHQVTPVSQTDGLLPRRLLQNGRVLIRQIEAVRPDIILIDELNHPSVFLTVKSLRTMGHILVAVVHHLRSLERGGPLDHLTARYMEHRMLENMHGYIVNSHHTGESLDRLLGRPALPRVVATPGADNPLGRTRRPEVPMRVLFVGNIIPRKGLHRLIPALASLDGGSWELEICGDESLNPRYARRCRRMAAETGAGGLIRFHGRIDGARLEELRRRCEVLAVPSDHEGFGIVYLEAMRAAMIPVAAAAGGAGMLIRDGVDGFLVPPGDDRGLTRVLSQLAVHPEQREIMAAAALERSRSFPEWRISMNHAVDFLEELAG